MDEVKKVTAEVVRRCDGCFAYHIGGKPEHGQCRFNPPTVLVVVEVNPVSGPRQTINCYFPPVKPDLFCERFKPRESRES